MDSLISSFGFILLEVQNTQSLEESTKKIDSLEKQISALQDTIISTQNDKISGMNGDISSIVGIFGIIIGVLSLISVIAIVVIQYFNFKAKQNMEEAKRLTVGAHELVESANSINKDAAKELKEVKSKVKEMDLLLEVSKKHNIANLVMNRVRLDMEMFERSITRIHFNEVGQYKQFYSYSNLENVKKRAKERFTLIESQYNRVNNLIDKLYTTSLPDFDDSKNSKDEIFSSLDLQLDKLKSNATEFTYYTNDIILDVDREFREGFSSSNMNDSE